MDEILGPLAFALLIGGQFLAAIVLISSRKTIYADPNEHERGPRPQPVRPTNECPRAMELQHCVIPDVALAHLELARKARGREPQCPDDACQFRLIMEAIPTETIENPAASCGNSIRTIPTSRSVTS